MGTLPEGAGVACGVAGRTREGESDTGDRCVIRRHAEGTLLAVIDGLGHGVEAARAAEIAVEVVSTHASMDVAEIMESCDRRLRESRGVVMTLASVTHHGITTLGVGNVQGMLVRHGDLPERAEREFIPLRGGVVGYLLPRLRPASLPVGPGDVLVLATDGISIEFMTETRFSQPPQRIAEGILSRHAVPSDDALVLVARYIGG